MSAQQFSLLWNNYSTHITNALDDLRAEDELTDVTLCAEGNKIRAHKLLLSACSTFFRETFRENPCQHPVIILKGVSFIDLQAVVTFMYNGQVNVTQERLQCFLQTAEMLQIKGLPNMNEKHKDGLIPPLTNNTTKKRVAPLNSSVDARSNTPDNVQRPLTSNSTMRRKNVVKTNPQPDRSNAGSAYNSPGPSSTTGNADGLASLMSHIQSDSNSVEAEDYPADGGLLNYDDQEGLGEEEDEYSNNLSEENDNSMQDLSGVKQGAIDVIGWLEEGDDYRIGITAAGGQVLFHQGYRYQHEKSKGTKSYWKCKERKKNCRGRILKIGCHVQITQKHTACLPSK